MNLIGAFKYLTILKWVFKFCLFKYFSAELIAILSLIKHSIDNIPFRSFCFLKKYFYFSNFLFYKYFSNEWNIFHFCFHTRQSGDNRNARKSKIEIEKQKKSFWKWRKRQICFWDFCFQFFQLRIRCRKRSKSEDCLMSRTRSRKLPSGKKKVLKFLNGFMS